jgi:hypothetical protein
MPTHYCVETLEALLPCPSPIQEGPLQGSTYTWFTDGSSYVEGVYREQVMLWCP